MRAHNHGIADHRSLAVIAAVDNCGLIAYGAYMLIAEKLCLEKSAGYQIEIARLAHLGKAWGFGISLIEGLIDAGLLAYCEGGKCVHSPLLTEYISSRKRAGQKRGKRVVVEDAQDAPQPPVVEAAPVPAEAPSEETDASGAAWDAALHCPSKRKTKAGNWYRRAGTAPSDPDAPLAAETKARKAGMAEKQQQAIEDARVVAGWLDAAILTAHPRANTHPRVWIGDIEKLMRIDGAPMYEIEIVLQWLPTDPFWSVNILSGNKLRKHYIRLLERCKENQRWASKIAQRGPDAIVAQAQKPTFANVASANKKPEWMERV